jgi:hypothetical protein
MVGGGKVDDGCVRCWVGESCAAFVELRCGRRLRFWMGMNGTDCCAG